jgi:hypothetical protein
MSKLFTEVNASIGNEQYTKFTIDCNKIDFYYQASYNTTEVVINNIHIEIDMPYDKFQQTIMGEIIKVEHQNDILKLMAGYLSNNVITSISPEVLIKDCKGIIQKIASENNTL